MFTSELDQLYQRLEHYQLDDPNHELGFTRHLIRNNGWTAKYTARAIAEYKKFVFLTVVAEHQVVPSDTVDQVWHTHLLLTKSYWEEFCPQILGKKLHHHPTKGGKEERVKFHKFYRQTIANYQQYFGKPPSDIWSPPEIRFGKEVKMQRVSKVDNWIISKNLFQQCSYRLTITLGIIALVIGVISMQQVLATSTSEVSNSGSLRDWCYFLISICIGLLIRYQIRQPSTQPQKPSLDIYEVAYLAGGQKRAVELAITKLVYQGFLKPNVRHRTFAIAKTLVTEANSLEHQVMKRVRRTPEFKELKEVYGYKIDDLRMQLVQYKLLSELYPFVLLSYIIILFLYFFSFGGEIVSENQISYFWYVNLVAVLCLIIPGFRTRWGDRVLKDIRKKDVGFDPIQRFAIYGESTLSGGILDDLKQIYKDQKKEDDAAAGCGC